MDINLECYLNDGVTLSKSTNLVTVFIRHCPLPDWQPTVTSYCVPLPFGQLQALIDPGNNMAVECGM